MLRLDDQSVCMTRPARFGHDLLRAAATSMLVGCPSPQVSGHHANAIDFIEPYFSKFTSCSGPTAKKGEGRIELRFLGQKRPRNARTTSDTEDWRLIGCGHDITFHLDCNDGMICREQRWPTPLASVNPGRQFEILLAVIDAAPKCDGARDLELGITLDSPGLTLESEVYVVERCGAERRVRVVCNDDRQCLAVDVAPEP